jgi:hypothetical protein
MSSMEPEVRKFLKKILASVFAGLMWMILNMILGIYFDLFFIETKISMGNIIFYIIFIGSLVALILYYYHTWKTKFPHG